MSQSSRSMSRALIAEIRIVDPDPLANDRRRFFGPQVVVSVIVDRGDRGGIELGRVLANVVLGLRIRRHRGEELEPRLGLETQRVDDPLR